MHTHVTDHTRATPKQLAILTGEIAVALAEANPAFARVQKLLASKLATRKKISAAVLKALEIEYAPDPRVTHSQKLWAKLGMPIDCVDDLTMPEIPDGWAGVAIIPTVSNEALFALCKQHIRSWTYYKNLDDIKDEQDRPKCTYVLGHRGGVEPDQEHLSKSYDQCIREGLTFLTLKERICIELLYFAETGAHLDVDGVTITSSLTMDGCAFCASWVSTMRKFDVCGDYRRYAPPTAGPRQAVYT